MERCVHCVCDVCGSGFTSYDMQGSFYMLHVILLTEFRLYVMCQYVRIVSRNVWQCFHAVWQRFHIIMSSGLTPWCDASVCRVRVQNLAALSDHIGKCHPEQGIAEQQTLEFCSKEGLYFFSPSFLCTWCIYNYACIAYILYARQYMIIRGLNWRSIGIRL